MKAIKELFVFLIVLAALFFGFALVLGEKYANERPCAESGCDNIVDSEGEYCYIHRKGTKTQKKTTTAAARKRTAPVEDRDIFNAKGYDTFEDFYYDHYQDFFDYDDAREYFENNRY